MAPPQGHRNEYITASIAAAFVRVVHNITTPEKSSPACDPSARAYSDRPPLAMISGTPHTTPPSAAATRAAIRLRPLKPLRGSTSASRNNGNVSSAVCERIPIARPARKPPQISDDGLLNP